MSVADDGEGIFAKIQQALGLSEPRQAILFLLLQALVGALVLLQFNGFTILLGLASRIDAGDSGAHNNLGVLYAAQGRYDDARRVLETAVLAHPGYALAHENLGDIYARLAAQVDAVGQKVTRVRRETQRRRDTPTQS